MTGTLTHLVPQGVEEAVIEIEHHDVRQIDAIADDRGGGHDLAHPSAAREVEVLHKAEDAKGHHRYVHRAEVPEELQRECHPAGGYAAVESPHRDEVTRHEQHHGGQQGRRAVTAQVMAQHQVARETGVVVEQRRGIPAALAQHRGEDLVDINHQRGHHPEGQIALQLALAALPEPRREDGHEEIEADEHIDVPQVPHSHTPVHGDGGDVAQTVGPRLVGIQHVVHGVGHAPEQERPQHTREPLAKEGGGGVGRGQQEITRDDHKQQHTEARQAVDPTDGIGTGCLHGVLSVGNVIKLARMLPDHEQTGKHTEHIERIVSFFHC